MRYFELYENTDLATWGTHGGVHASLYDFSEFGENIEGIWVSPYGDPHFDGHDAMDNELHSGNDDYGYTRRDNTKRKIIQNLDPNYEPHAIEGGRYLPVVARIENPAGEESAQDFNNNPAEFIKNSGYDGIVFDDGTFVVFDRKNIRIGYCPKFHKQ